MEEDSYSYVSYSYEDEPSVPVAYTEALRTELNVALTTTDAEEKFAQQQAELRCAATSAAYKQMQMYRHQRKETLQKLIKEKKEYIELLKQRIAEYPEDA